ncbi:MAG: CidA/LrgA family protein [Fusobacteria bacterium]|nr:CidA/LrgA family protein [Fusobacteriota bacterium]
MNKLKYLTLKIILPILILFLFQYIGILINKYFINYVPGAIIGMLLLLAALRLKIVPYIIMKDFTNIFIKHISFFLIPTTVSIISIFSLLNNELPIIIGVLIISLIIVLTSVGYFVVFLTKNNESYIEDKEIK